MSQEDDLDLLDVDNQDSLKWHSPVRCGTYRTPPILTPRELRAANFVYRFINRQMDRVKAGKPLRLPEPLLSKIKRRTLEQDMGDCGVAQDHGDGPIFI
jgi:hypothetical protein